MNNKHKSIFMIAALIMICLLMVVLIVKPSKEEVYAKKFLNKFYNISDYEQSAYLTKSSSVLNDQIESQEDTQYRDYFTDHGYDLFITQKINNFYEELAYENKCTLSVKSVNFNQERYIAIDDLREFSFKAVIEVTYNETKSVKTFTQEGSIDVKSINGETKIDSIQFLDQNEIKSEIALNK